MAKFTIKITGLKQATAEIKRLPVELRDPLRLKLGIDVRGQIRNRAFIRGLDKDGKRFKIRKDGVISRLRVKGDLLHAVRYNSARKRVEVAPSSGQLGKAEAHQYGKGPAYSKSRQPRAFFGLSKDDEKSLNRRTLANVKRTVKEWGGRSKHWRVVGNPVKGTKPLKVTR